MKKFLVLYLAPPEAMAGNAHMNEEDQKKGVEAWMHWAHSMGHNLLDLGSPLMYATVLNAGMNASPATKNVAGYSIIQAPSVDEATKMFQEHPHIKWHPGTSVEFHEIMPLPGSTE